MLFHSFHHGDKLRSFRKLRICPGIGHDVYFC